MLPEAKKSFRSGGLASRGREAICSGNPVEVRGIRIGGGPACLAASCADEQVLGLVVGASFCVACPLVQVIMRRSCGRRGSQPQCAAALANRIVRCGRIGGSGWRRETLAIEVMFAPYSNIACWRDV